MTADVQIGQGDARRPWKGVTVYLSGDGTRAYATEHDLVPGPRGRWSSGPRSP